MAGSQHCKIRASTETPLQWKKGCSKKGVTLGGRSHDSLTAETIRKLQIYYSRAIREDKTVKEMRRNILASIYHSSNDLPQHQFCPPGPDSCCSRVQHWASWACHSEKIAWLSQREAWPKTRTRQIEEKALGFEEHPGGAGEGQEEEEDDCHCQREGKTKKEAEKGGMF
ncbi:hypothetical protein RRG08_048705 [Elysia crispata]|uniref:Uncharacterized protein n=1 Tax=Elysia crispata TaxID=231223 RepID=A0AAE1A8S2_9GAST|nr:hypothetical protein RRG08_048705 [Elysia crispata]